MSFFVHVVPVGVDPVSEVVLILTGTDPVVRTHHSYVVFVGSTPRFPVCLLFFDALEFGT